MKTVTKKITVMVMAVLMVLGVLAGCRAADTSTAAGTLQTMLSGMKNGNFQQIGEIVGSGFSTDTWGGITEQDAQRLFRAMFGNINVKVTEKESDEGSAVVAVKGETGDLASMIPKVGQEIKSDFMEWYQKNKDHVLDLSQEEMQHQMMEIIIQSFEKHTHDMQREPVDTEIRMTKNEEGKWMVDSESTSSVIYVMFGSEGLENIQSLLNNLV